jgi:hypothetical protein
MISLKMRTDRGLVIEDGRVADHSRNGAGRRGHADVIETFGEISPDDQARAYDGYSC